MQVPRLSLCLAHPDAEKELRQGSWLRILAILAYLLAMRSGQKLNEYEHDIVLTVGDTTWKPGKGPD